MSLDSREVEVNGEIEERVREEKAAAQAAGEWHKQKAAEMEEQRDYYDSSVAQYKKWER